MDAPNSFNQSFTGYLDKLQLFTITNNTDGHSRISLCDRFSVG